MNVMGIKEVGEVIGFFKNRRYCERYNNSVKDEVRIVYKFYGGWYNEKDLEERNVKMEEVKKRFEKEGWMCKWYRSCCCNGDGYVLCFSFRKKRE